VSIQTTERYLGCKQKLRFAVNDKIVIARDGLPVPFGLLVQILCPGPTVRT
jgi:hypothetical protein